MRYKIVLDNTININRVLLWELVCISIENSIYIVNYDISADF